MDNNFYDELKKFLNNIENPFRPEGDIFTVKIFMSQNVEQKRNKSETFMIQKVDTVLRQLEQF